MSGKEISCSQHTWVRGHNERSLIGNLRKLFRKWIQGGDFERTVPVVTRGLTIWVTNQESEVE